MPQGPGPDGAAVLGAEGLVEAQPDPDGHAHRRQHLHQHDRPPRAEHQHQRPGSRCEHGDEDEHGHDEGHEPGHLVALGGVAHQGDAEAARGCGAEAPQEAGGVEGGERRRDRRQEPADDEDAEPEVEQRLAAVAVRDGAVVELAGGEAEEERGDDARDRRVARRQPEVGPHLGERRQQHVDGQRGQP
jgi:hypothetical protein